MSESRKDRRYCQKCGAPVDPTDKKCPNGHVFAEVGRAYVRSARAKPHGRTGTLRVKFKRGLPGQALGTKVRIVSEWRD